MDSKLRYNLDVCPTLAELLSQPRAARWDGLSFAGAINGEETPGHPYLVLSQCAHVCQRSVRWGPWLWIRTWHDGYHLFPEEMLFRVEDDPHEQHDLVATHPDVCREAATLYDRWLSDVLRDSPGGDPMITVLEEGGPFHARGHLKRYVERLKSTGREHAVPELIRRHPQEKANG